MEGPKVRRKSLAVGLALLALMLAAACSTEVKESPRTTGSPARNEPTILFGDRLVSIEIAATNDQRGVGLMDRESLEDDEGMLFVFPERAQRSFYMKNTLIPLAIAYLDLEGDEARILEILEMTPCGEQIPCPLYPSKSSQINAALEVRAAWFTDYGVEAGAIGHIKGQLPTPQ